MRFLLYNIRYGAGVARGFHFPLPYQGYLRRTTRQLGHITEFIKSLRPDIVGLVEADAGSFRMRRGNQVELIAKALGHYHAYESKYGVMSRAARLPLMRKQVNALLTREVIEAERFHYFRSGVKRLIIELELRGLTVYLVHLSIRYKTRHEQLRALGRLVRDRRSPCIVAGDFNIFRGPAELEPLLTLAGLKLPETSGMATYPSWRPRRQLDFILHSPDIKVQSYFAPAVMFSDHLPVVCDFEVKRP
ncbi:MAG: endonuclease/exonuclease/phosphatase family protein [Kiritimatiellaeota bacterium]|nr:endonuclease/exonuclease/phosphatase family protein [Kiritimatiellota bacterium]